MSDYTEVRASDLTAGMIIRLDNRRELWIKEDVTFTTRGIIHPTNSVRWTGLVFGTNSDGDYFETPSRDCGFGWRRNHTVSVR